jgi:hypothetical protein
MSWINNYTYPAMTDQQERDIARLADSDWQVRQALGGRVGWWRRLARRQQRVSTATQHPAQRRLATPEHRVCALSHRSRGQANRS